MRVRYKLSVPAFVLIGLWAPAFCQAPAAVVTPREAPADAKSVVVPFELLRSGHMAVMVKLNGKGPYRVVFDTGAPMNLLTPKVAKESEVKGTIDTLEIGDLKLEKVGAMVFDHPTVRGISKAINKLDGVTIEGIIGFPVFAKYKTSVDFEKMELTFTPNGYAPRDTMKMMMERLMSSSKKPEPRVAAPAGLWGFAVDKGEDDEADGVNVKEVFGDSAAAAAGLKVGDRLLTLDGRWTDSVIDTLSAASYVKPGHTALLVVKRDGKEVKLTVKPAKGT